MAHGLDLDVDLVGGELLHTVATPLATGSRVIVCGLIAEVSSGHRRAGPDPGLWIRDHVSPGIERAPRAFCSLMRGENIGKSVVNLESMSRLDVAE